MGSDVTVDFALFFSPEGLALAHRQGAGHWALAGEAPLEGDLAAAMAGLKSAAEARGCADGRVLLVLPDDQVLYTSFMAPADDPERVTERIVEGLEGMTPYAVADLAYDWRAVEVDRVKVAVVAQETLGEAAQFAKANGFEPAGFAAMPPVERFPGIALFGKTRPDLPEAESGMAFGGDDWAKAEAEAAQAREAEAAAPVEADPAAPSEEAPKAAPAETPDTKGREAEAEAEDAPEAVPKTADTEDAPPAAITDPTLDQPVMPLAADAGDDTAAPQPAPAAGSGAPDAPDTPPEPVETAKSPDAPERSEAAGPATPPDERSATPPEAVEPAALPPETTDTPSAPVAPTRGKARKPAADAKPLTADKPDGAAPRPARFTPVAAPGDAVTGDDGPTPAAAPDTDARPAEETPSLTFGARRGKAAKPTADAGRIVSNRPARLGFGAAAAPREEPVLHPDAAAPTSSESRTGAAGPAKPGNRLAAQLARVRDASRSRPAAASDAAPPAAETEAPRRADPMPDIAARDLPDEAKSATGPGTTGRAGLFRRRGASDAPASASAAAAGTAVASSENALNRGLLARKQVDDNGPSFKTGLILTLVLLVLLALIAIWSVLFLPESPMARLFSGDRDRESATLSVPQTPEAISAPPAVDTVDAGDTVEATVAPADTDLAALVPGPDEAQPLSERATDPTDPTDLADLADLADAQDEAEVPLPDIDADLELPPLPPLPEDALPSLEETEAIYAADGIWPRTPERPFFESFAILDDIYVASIDPTLSTFDAIALPPAGVDLNESLRRVPAPPPFGVVPDRDARGLVEATPEGVLTPEGAFVVLGRPPVAAVPRPREVEPAADDTPVIDVEDAILGTFQPSPRPGDLEETRERQLLGGLSIMELADRRPGPRPQSAQEAAARASLVPGDGGEEAEAAPETVSAAAAPVTGGTRLAVAQSLLPRSRPGNIEAIVASAERAPAPVVEARAVAAAPSIPSNADVTRAATERNAIRLRDVNLIGVTGTPSNRRALVRLPSGRFVRVGVGDRLDGGRVAAIGENSLQYVRNGRNITLDIPS